MISRAHMRRQLRANGGITNLRQGYGLGDFVRKLIPNELADIASKAAPFVAPFNPLAAGIMRGVGRYDKRGSLKDALKQGVLTYAGGQGARMLGGAGIQTGFDPRTGSGIKGGKFFSDFRSPGKFFKADVKHGGEEFLKSGAKKDIGLPGFRDISKKLNLKIPGLGSVSELAKQQLLFGATTGGITYIYEKFMNEEPEQQPGESYGEYLARRKKNVAAKMRQYKDNYLAFDKDWTAMSDEEKNEQIQSELTEYDVPDANMNQGGRVGNAQGGRIGYSSGSGEKAFSKEENLKRFEAAKRLAKEKGISLQEALDITLSDSYRTKEAQGGRIGYAYGTNGDEDDPLYEVEPFIPDSNSDDPGYLEGKMQDIEGPKSPQQMAEFELMEFMEEFESVFPEMKSLRGTKEYMQSLNEYFRGLTKQKSREGIQMANEYDMQEYIIEFESVFPEMIPLRGTDEYNEDLKNYFRGLASKQNKPKQSGIMQVAQGGRIGYAIGSPEKQLEAGAPPIIYEGNMDPRAQNQKTGLPSVPGPIRMAPDGPEFDMRENGGFQPLGRQEGKDDVPAILAKNEFVMTADAVRAAGGGSIEKGAQKMYDTMKKLESRVS